MAKSFTELVELIKKLASGEVDMEAILNPNPVYIVDVKGRGRYKVNGKTMRKAEFEAWRAMQTNAALVWIEERMKPSKEEKLLNEAQAPKPVVNEIPEAVGEVELTEQQKKDRWWNRLRSKPAQKTEYDRAMEIYNCLVPQSDGAIAGFTPTPEHDEILETLTQINRSHYGIQGF